MKKIVIALTLALILTTSVLADFYPKAMVVTDFDKHTDEVICVDFSDNEWAFFGIENYNIGDIVVTIMEDNGTTEIFDDEIVIADYSGLTEIQ